MRAMSRQLRTQMIGIGREQLQVLRSIVLLPLVPMMDDFRGMQIPAQHFLHHEPML